MFDRLDRTTFGPASVIEKLSFHRIKSGGSDLARCGVDFQCYQATSLNCSPYLQVRGTKRSQFRETNRTIRNNQFRDTSDPPGVHLKIDGSLSEINWVRTPGLENNEPTTRGLRLLPHRSNDFPSVRHSSRLEMQAVDNRWQPLLLS